MIHSKSIEVLKTLSKEDLRHFNDFVRSPFHNKNKKLIKLLDALVKYHPAYDIENEEVYSKVYPEKSYSHDNMKKLMSELNDLAEHFLIQIRFKERHITQKLYLLQQFDCRKLDHLFMNYASKLELELDNDESNIYEKYILQLCINDFYENREKYKSAIDNLFKRSIYSVHYMFQMLDLDTNDTTACRINFNLKNKIFLTDIFNNNFDFDSFLKDIEENNLYDKYLKLRCNSILLFKNPENEIYYKEVERLLLNMHESILSQKQKRIANGETRILLEEIIKLRNYCEYMAIKQSAEDQVSNRRYTRRSFELCKLDLKVRNALSNGEFYLEKPFYNNIIQIGMELEENDFVEQFINTYTIHGDAKEQTNMYNFAKSYLELSKKNFEESLKFASECNIDGWLEKNKLKQITMLCYYELNYLESAVSLVDSYNHYLSHTQELPENFKKVFKEYIRLYNELLKMKLDNEKIDGFVIQSIRSELSRKFVLYRKWFLDKLKEFDNSIIDDK